LLVDGDLPNQNSESEHEDEIVQKESPELKESNALQEADDIPDTSSESGHEDEEKIDDNFNVGLVSRKKLKKKKNATEKI